MRCDTCRGEMKTPFSTFSGAGSLHDDGVTVCTGAFCAPCAAPYLSDGYPHDYGQRCCCADCTGPEGTDCVPDLYGDCARCGRKAEHDDPDGQYVAAIVARLADQAEGQTSWLV